MTDNELAIFISPRNGFTRWGNKLNPWDNDRIKTTRHGAKVTYIKSGMRWFSAIA